MDKTKKETKKKVLCKHCGQDIDAPWKPLQGNDYVAPKYDAEDQQFVSEDYTWDDNYADKEVYERGWVFKEDDDDGCTALCNKLNEAIKAVKP